MLLAITITGPVLAAILGPAITLALLQVGLLIGAMATSRANARHNKEQIDRLEKSLNGHLTDSAQAVTNLARLEVTVGAQSAQCATFQKTVAEGLKENGEKTDQWRATAENRLALLERSALGQAD